MWRLNLGWLALGLATCLVSQFTPDADLITALFWGAVLISLIAWCARGPGLFLAVLTIGAIAVCQFYYLSQPELAWAPLMVGALLGTYNLGSARPFTPTIALSQLVILLAPVPTLTAHLSWEAVPAGIAGVALAGFAAFSVSVWTYAHEA